MNLKVFLNALLILSLSAPSFARAGSYAEFSVGQVIINSPTAISRPLIADVRIGYAQTDHQFELAFMTSVEDDNINQLVVQVPSVLSVLYHYIPNTHSSLKFHYIVGASRVSVDSTIPGVAASSDDFSGLSYGFGFEESFESIPRLKISIDLMQLYRGKQLDIYSTHWGVHYEF
jgi:hypothetical protein